MSYAQELPSYISPEDYLLREERAATKHEYLDGVIYERQGASKQHNCVSLNICIVMRAQLSGRPFDVFVADVFDGL